MSENSKTIQTYTLHDWTVAVLESVKEGYTEINTHNDYIPRQSNGWTYWGMLFKPEEPVVAEKATPSVAKKATTPKKDIHAV